MLPPVPGRRQLGSGRAAATGSQSVRAGCFAPSKWTCITFISWRRHQTCRPWGVHPTSSCAQSRGEIFRGFSSRHRPQCKNPTMQLLFGRSISGMTPMLPPRAATCQSGRLLRRAQPGVQRSTRPVRTSGTRTHRPSATGPCARARPCRLRGPLAPPRGNPCAQTGPVRAGPTRRTRGSRAMTLHRHQRSKTQWVKV